MRQAWLNRRHIVAGVALSGFMMGMAGAGKAADNGIAASLDSLLKGGKTETYSRIATIAVPGQPLSVFDIGFADAKLPLYYLADRSNAALDIFDTRTNTVAAQIGGFVGVKSTDGVINNGISGPDGVQVVGSGEIWVGDGDSTVKVVDLYSEKIVDTISTALPNTATADLTRADEMAYDPKDHILVVANNAASPPFITFISTNPNDRHVLGHIVYTAAAGVEASVYDPSNGLFDVNLTQFGTDVNSGAISVVNPRLQSEVAEYPVANCNGAGIALGPKHNLLVGCSLTNNSQIFSTQNGTLLATIPQVSGSDEIWFNPGDNKFYLAARGNSPAAGGPVLGVIDALTNKFVTNISTSASAHSVSVESRNNHIFVPFGPTPSDPSCTNGCIVVYAGKQASSPLDRSIEQFVDDLQGH